MAAKKEFSWDEVAQHNKVRKGSRAPELNVSGAFLILVFAALPFF